MTAVAATVVSAAARATATAPAVACAGACVLVLAAPFEARTPVLRAQFQELSSVEAVLVAVLGLWLAASVWTREAPPLRTPLTAPWLAFIAAMTVAAVLSDHRANALHMVGRFGVAFAIYLMTVSGASIPGGRRAIAVGVVASATVAAIIVVLEFAGIGAVMQCLRMFRSDLALVGAQVRAGGPFQYPTIAAMFLEIAFAMALGLLALAIDRRRRAEAILIAAATLLISEAIVLTFTRAGLLAMALSLSLVAWSRYRSGGVDRVVKVLALIAVAVGAQLMTSRSAESLRLRFFTEGQDRWYRAEIEAPRQLTMSARSRGAVPITLTNTGGNTWDPHAQQPFRVSYHWLLADADRVVSWEGLRTELPGPVTPGATVRLRASVEAPRHPGRYRLLWDVEQEHRLWFSTEPGSTLAISHATITGDGAGLNQLDTRPLPGRAVRPGRPVLWSAAARMIAEHPIAGVGPDNYRLLYGQYADIVPADPRIHSNNMYLEVLTGGGVIAAVPFAWLLWRAAWHARSPALAAVAVHGIFDSFLSFTPTYILIAVTLAAAPSADTADVTHANRL